jgi:hypothetical protein
VRPQLSPGLGPFLWPLADAKQAIREHARIRGILFCMGTIRNGIAKAVPWIEPLLDYFDWKSAWSLWWLALPLVAGLS